MEIYIPPALVLGCNTLCSIGVLSDFIEEQTGHPLDLDQSGWSDILVNINGYGGDYGYDNGDGYGYGYGYGNGGGHGDGHGSGYGGGNGYGDGYIFGYGDDCGNGNGNGDGYSYVESNDKCNT